MPLLRLHVPHGVEALPEFRNTYGALWRCGHLHHIETCFTVPLELSKEENHHILAGNGGRRGSLWREGWDPAGLEEKGRVSMLSYRPAQEERQPRGEGIWVHVDLCPWAPLKFIAQLMGTSSLLAPWLLLGKTLNLLRCQSGGKSGGYGRKLECGEILQLLNLSPKQVLQATWSSGRQQLGKLR